MHTTLTQRAHNEPKGKPEERQSFQLRLRPSVYAKVKRIAQQFGVSNAYVLERCIESFDGLK